MRKRDHSFDHIQPARKYRLKNIQKNLRFWHLKKEIPPEERLRTRSRLRKNGVARFTQKTVYYVKTDYGHSILLERVARYTVKAYEKLLDLKRKMFEKIGFSEERFVREKVGVKKGYAIAKSLSITDFILEAANLTLFAYAIIDTGTKLFVQNVHIESLNDILKFESSLIAALASKLNIKIGGYVELVQLMLVESLYQNLDSKDEKVSKRNYELFARQSVIEQGLDTILMYTLFFIPFSENIRRYWALRSEIRQLRHIENLHTYAKNDEKK